MKCFWLTLIAGTALVAPACAQENPVKYGVEAWERGDYDGAVKSWRGPAQQGDADAQFNLAQAYKLGRGVPADLAQAEQWYRKAALQGHRQAEDFYALALFQNGKRTEALPWLERSATHGEPRTQFVLGTMYFNGDGVKKDWPRAYALVTRASQSGMMQASNALGEMDKVMSTSDRQKGLALARDYADAANRPPLPPVRVAEAPSRPRPSATTPAATRPAPVAAPRATGGAWRVQLGAFGDPGNARRLWGQVSGRFPGRQVSYVKAGKLTRVLVGPYASRAEAAAACGAVRPCVATLP